MAFAAILLPLGLMRLVLTLGRYEEWPLRESAPASSARHVRDRRHLSVVLHTSSRRQSARSEAAQRRISDAA
ncbi:hypothetical protein ABZ612_35325 [Streptomyces avermitilis]|uniref:hypothetical protein n=1 Tax=Streptomyces avermitilis TaxID=33903 RepID=UPI0033C180DE